MDSTTPFQPWAVNESGKSVKSERELVDDAKLHRENVNHPKHTRTASYDEECVGGPNVAPGPSSAPGLGSEPARVKSSSMDPGKISSMQQIVENTLSQESKQHVLQVIEAVEALSGAERLLLYLRLPTGVPPQDPLKQPINALGSRAELQQTVTWIQTHLEVDPDVSLPKQDVYDEYIAHCMSSNMKPLSTADFGKVMKQVYPSVRPRRLGTRGNSRYCYAGLRKKIKLEVPQLPDLGQSSKESDVEAREAERIVCDWAEVKLGANFPSIRDLSRHLASERAAGTSSPPPLQHAHVAVDEHQGSRQLLKQLKRKIQTQGTPGRPKKNKAQEVIEESPPTTSYAAQPPAMKLEAEPEPYYPAYMPIYEPRPGYYPPPRSLAPPPPPPPDYRDPYAFEYTADPHLPINLSSDARAPPSPRRRADPPPARLPLPGKKLILETYQSETRAPEPLPAPPPAQYLPKKMRAAENFGGKLAAARLAVPSAPPAPPAGPSTPARPDSSFLDDPKNVTRRSTSTAAALAREQLAAAAAARSPDSCCGLDGVSLRTGVICQEKHSEILNRERVISICNIDKHDLDDYLNEGSSQEHEEELLQYFHRRDTAADRPPPQHSKADFLEAGLDPPDDHSQGKNEKLSQLRELLAKNLKNPSGSSAQSAPSQEPPPQPDQTLKGPNCDGAFKPVVTGATSEVVNRPTCTNHINTNGNKHSNLVPTENGIPYSNGTDHVTNQVQTNVNAPQMYNGNCHNVPQSPTTRTQQYDFVPISDNCHSPGNFHSKSPVSFSQRGVSPTKINKVVVMGGSLQTSPVSHSTAASPFVSPRNTPVPRSRLCSRPIPKHNGRKRRNPLSLGVVDPCSKQFAIPNDQKFNIKNSGHAVQYCQPMSAPPSPNILCSQYKSQMLPFSAGIPNGVNNLRLNFLGPYSDHVNGELSQPLSADPLSSEVSQFFQESLIAYRPEHDASFRSQSVPLKQGINNIGIMSYNNTPVGSVPPTPVPNEFCDFGSLADTCDISKAGLNPETLNKIYHAIDCSNDVMTSSQQSVLNSSEALSNGCDPLPAQQLLTDEQLSSLIPSDGELLDRSSQFNQSFADDGTTSENVEDFLKRANNIEFDLTDLVAEKNKYNTSRSVPSTPLPYRRAAPNLQIDSRRSRVLFPDNFPSLTNGISSKSVPSTPQLPDDRNVFSYSNRDFLINGNSVDVCSTSQMHGNLVDNNEELTSPLHDMLREEILEPLTPAADLLADLDKIDGTPYVDL